MSIGSFLSLPFDNSTHNDILLAVHQLALASAPGHARRPDSTVFVHRSMSPTLLFLVFS